VDEGRCMSADQPGHLARAGVERPSVEELQRRAQAAKHGLGVRPPTAAVR
jgi:hypothetical protein